MYGVVLGLGLIASYLITKNFWKKNKLEVDLLDALYLYTVLFTVLGARLYHVFDKFTFYMQNPQMIFAIWEGGLGIYGGLLGGFIGVNIFYLRNKNKIKISLLKLLDLIIPGVALAQAVGRWGNFFNQEVFGGPTNLPWGWFIPLEKRPLFWQNYAFFHPTFLYESVWMLVGFLLLLKLAKSDVNKSGGMLSGVYLIWYGVGRFFLEFLRFDTATVGGIKIAHIFSLISIVAGIFLISKIRRRD